MPPDRLERLRHQQGTTFTGIDFVEVDARTQTGLDVHFYLPLTPPLTPGDAGKVTIRSKTGAADVPPVSVTAIAMPSADVLHVTTDAPGGFAPYVIHIGHDNIDPYFNDVTFSFKAACDAALDCAATEPPCPPAGTADFPVDYLARDFQSFRRALLEFASQRYPGWADRLEADAGVMVAELLSALGDELSYSQDRNAREAYLETATQRRSIRRHARLVDYTMHDGLGATTWLDVTVSPGKDAQLQAGDRAWANRDGRKIVFEVGCGLDDVFPAGSTEKDPRTFPLSSALNSLGPHIWDSGSTCLEPGATQLDVEARVPVAGSLAALLKNGALPGPTFRRQVLLKTSPADPATRARAVLVPVTAVEDLVDPLDPGRKIARLFWDATDATQVELDLEVLEIRANLVPATAGETRGPVDFTIGAPWIAGGPVERAGPLRQSLPGAVRAVERDFPPGSLQAAADTAGSDGGPGAPRRPTIYLYSLPGTDTDGLVWRGGEPRLALPEIRLFELEEKAPHEAVESWEFRRSFLGSPSSLPASKQFTLDDGTWRRIVGYERDGKEIVHAGYASGDGATIRFGDGEFGQVPDAGVPFRAYYRIGNGTQGNLAAGAITNFDNLAGVAAVTNQLPISDGVDPETREQVRLLAPDAFRAVAFRAVLAEDYAEAAERLEWVQRAGAAFRWTGSWLTAFATPDPRDDVAISDAHRRELQEQMERFRQAGRPAFAADPLYADLDLKITLCIEPSAYAAQVVERARAALVGSDAAFFAPDHFTFGDPLHRSLLEAALQAVPGVRAVESILVRRRGVFDWRPFSDLTLEVAKNEVVRVMNDPLHPARGSVVLDPKGGA